MNIIKQYKPINLTNYIFYSGIRSASKITFVKFIFVIYGYICN